MKVQGEMGVTGQDVRLILGETNLRAEGGGKACLEMTTGRREMVGETWTFCNDVTCICIYMYLLLHLRSLLWIRLTRKSFKMNGLQLMPSDSAFPPSIL